MPIEVLKDQRNVRIDGKVVDLGARAFDVLACLHTNADRVVTKQELLDEVWAGLMVEESNLTVQIAGLRKVLGRSAIKTVPGIGYRFTPADHDAPAASSAADLPLPSIPSLAVLPFANLTGSPDREYLVDGIVNEVISALSRVSSFFVTSSTSSFTYRGRVVDLAEVGHELGVRYVLEGSIQQAGDQMRIFTQLVEAQTGHMIWQDRFDGLASEIFELQDRVAEHVAGALEPKLIWAEAARARAKPTDSLDAYDLCLRAAPMIYRQASLEVLENGIELLRQALALDPNHVQAKALVCYGHTCGFANRWWPFERAAEALPLAHEVMNSTTDDPLALAYVGHYVAYIGKLYQQGLAVLTQASLLNPNSATVSLLKGWVHIYLDDNAAAIEQFHKTLRISPLHPQIAVARCGIANALVQQGDIEGAVPHYERALNEYPAHSSATLGLIGCYWALGRPDDSARMAAAFRAKVPEMTVSTLVKTIPQTNAAYLDMLVRAFQANGFPP